jgi:hypothetical protein
MENNTGPDFNNIQTALTTLSTELPRIENIQQILGRFDSVEQTLQTIQQIL